MLMICVSKIGGCSRSLLPLEVVGTRVGGVRFDYICHYVVALTSKTKALLM
jgi:hypothetical protein